MPGGCQEPGSAACFRENHMTPVPILALAHWPTGSSTVRPVRFQVIDVLLMPARANLKKTPNRRDNIVRSTPASECQPHGSTSYLDKSILRISAAPQAKFDSRG